MGNQILSECSNVLAIEDVPAEEDAHKGPKLMLRVGVTPVEQSLGSILFPFKAGEEIGILDLQQVKAWDALRWRFEQSARERSAGRSTQRRPSWPDSPRCGLRRNYYRAHVLAADGQGGFVEHYCMLEVISDKQQRRMENIQIDLEDAKDAASHAHRFNLYLSRTLANQHGATAVDEEVPTLKVAAPIGCFVVGGVAANVAAPGDAVLLAPYSAQEVHKFVYDGSEDFNELPQAFFHYTACQTGGNIFVCDIQGVEGDDGGFTLIDPVVLRAPRPGIRDLLGVVVSGPGQGSGGVDQEGPSPERFDAVHPRCGELCKVFDPQRRSAHQRKHCGLGVSCGVGGA